MKKKKTNINLVMMEIIQAVILEVFDGFISATVNNISVYNEGDAFLLSSQDNYSV